MAKNMRFKDGKQLSVTCSHPTTPASGDPIRYGELVGVALTAERADGKTSVQFEGVFDLSVRGVDAGGNSAVAEGDKLFYVDADTPPISKKVAGRPVGVAMGAVTSGATATIPVRLNGTA